MEVVISNRKSQIANLNPCALCVSVLKKEVKRKQTEVILKLNGSYKKAEKLEKAENGGGYRKSHISYLISHISYPTSQYRNFQLINLLRRIIPHPRNHVRLNGGAI